VKPINRYGLCRGLPTESDRYRRTAPRPILHLHATLSSLSIFGEKMSGATMRLALLITGLVFLADLS